MTHQHIPDFESKLRSIVSHGLIAGLGKPEPGKLCIEAAICLALGEPHSDTPSCVAAPDRSFAIGLNDALWSSPQARARGMLPLALAQLGTVGTDRTRWVRPLALGTVQRVLPLALRAAGLTSHAEECAKAKTLEEAKAAASSAAGNAYAASSSSPAANAAYAYAAASSSAAANAANAAVRAAAYAAVYVDNACYAAYVAGRAAADAGYADNAARDRKGDEVLLVAVDVALRAYEATGWGSRQGCHS